MHAGQHVYIVNASLGNLDEATITIYVHEIAAVAVQISRVTLTTTLSKKRNSLKSPCTVLAPDQFDQRLNALAGYEVLGEQVRGVNVPADLSKLNRTNPHLLLDPERLRVNMT